MHGQKITCVGILQSVRLNYMFSIVIYKYFLLFQGFSDFFSGLPQNEIKRFRGMANSFCHWNKKYEIAKTGLTAGMSFIILLAVLPISLYMLPMFSLILRLYPSLYFNFAMPHTRIQCLVYQSSSAYHSLLNNVLFHFPVPSFSFVRTYPLLFHFPSLFYCSCFPSIPLNNLCLLVRHWQTWMNCVKYHSIFAESTMR